MRGTPIFDIRRTVRTYRAFLPEHADVLEDLLRSVSRIMERLMPVEVSARIDREGSCLVKGADGRLSVKVHGALDAARRELASLGCFRIFLPEPYGGYGLPLCIYYLVVQLVSYYDTSLALVFLVHGNAMYAIERYGTKEQREQYLPRLASGELLATIAFTEPTAGSDPSRIRARARRSRGSWILSGEKLFITHGGDADILVTTARTGSPEDGIRGLSTFILEREADGVEVVGLEDKTGLSGSPTAALSYPDLCIPGDRLLGPLGRGAAVMFAGVGMTRVNIAAQALGIAKRAFEAAASFALEREQGGALIVEHDAIRHRLARMALAIGATEALVCMASRLEHRGEWHVREMSVAKYYASEELQDLTSRAIGVLGGYGVSRALGVERCRREAAALPLYGGTSEIQWYILSRELLASLDGSGHTDYRARDEAWLREAEQRCRDGRLSGAVERIGRAHVSLWEAVRLAASMGDAGPFHRHLAELATAMAVAQALVFVASGPDADEELDVELALWALDELEDAIRVHAGAVSAGDGRAALKLALRRRL